MAARRRPGPRIAAGPLASRPLRALLAAETISLTGSQMTWLALPWFVLATTGSAARMSIVLAAEVSAYAVFGVPSGSVLRRLGARATMLSCDSVRAALVLAIPALHEAGALPFAALVAISFLVGLASTPYGAAQRVILPALVGEDEAAVARANALFQGANRITLLLGPTLAGVLIGAVGATNVLVVDGLTYAAALALVLLFVPAHREEAPGEEHVGIASGIRYLRRDRLLGAWCVAIAIGDAAFQVIFAGIPVLVFRDYGRDPRLAGLLLAAWGCGAVAGNVASYRRFAGGASLSLVAALVFVQALPIWALALPLTAAALAVAVAVSGMANGLVNPTIHSLITLRPPPELRPHVLTATFTASTVGAPLALLLAGPAFAAFGPRGVLAAAAALQTLAMAILAAAALRVEGGAR